MEAAPSRGRLARVAGLLLLTYAYFYQAGDWGTNVRFDLIRAIVEQRTLIIDDYRDNTLDLTVAHGHYYLDKAPGPSLLAVPFVAVARAGLAVAGVPAASPRGIAIQSYVAVVAVASLPTVCGAIALLLAALAMGASVRASRLGALVYALGSPAFAYATLLWGHPLATAGLAVAFAAAIAARRARPPRGAFWHGVLVGGAAGLATLAELTSAPPAAAIAALALIHAWPERTQRRPIVLGIAAGALACGAVLAAYNTAAFGSPVAIGYGQNLSPQFGGMKHGLFGIGAPSAHVLWEILFGIERGLLPLVPVFAAAPIGLGLLIRDRATRAAGIVCAGIVVYYLLMNAGYAYWDGGGSYGPRHIAPVCAFLAVGLPPLWDLAGRAVRALLATLMAYGIVAAFVVVATFAIPDDAPLGPLPTATSQFLDGKLAWNYYGYHYEPPNDVFPRRPEHLATLTRDSWNLGEAFGLRGLPSLLPLLGLWALGVAAWHRQRKLR